ncbi:hypothetical protein H4R18_000674 [Coemansia javaensis]|uniref:Uncharacterized protein n=1 Tax=Coemansia javaensis TaxID=2761396 RepID=A0A9W8LKA7_9FUNG|nr:hypothetical protein H4R18_000674 [Coemansia javaensis]
MTAGPVTVDPPRPKPPQPPPAASAASAAADGALTAAERDAMIGEAEQGFRDWLRTSAPAAGYVMYPSTRQIHRSLQVLSKAIEDLDLSGIAL